jgi:hypothetical protein
VFFLCGDYAQKECGLEWRAGRDLLKQKEDDRLMFLRLDRADIPGLFSIDGYLDISGMPDNEVAIEILKRLAILARPPLSSSSDSFNNPLVARPVTAADPSEYWRQRKGLPNTDIMREIWSKPRWRIWIRPTEFRRARFRNLEHCREFILSSYVRFQGQFPYPWVSSDSIETGDDWIAGEIDKSDAGVSHAECWALFRSGQFVQNRAFDEIPQLGDGVHVLEILDTTTAAFELAARMAHQGVLSLQAAVTFELNRVAGRGLTWPQDILGDSNAVGPNCWCQNDEVSVNRMMATDELETRRRELALEAALEVYSNFCWSDPPRKRLSDEQYRGFGVVRE